MINLLRRLARRHLSFLLTCGALLAGFELVVCAVVGNVDVGGLLSDLAPALPPFFQALLSQQALVRVNATGLIAFGWNHPIVHALGGAVAVVLGSRAIAGEIERGTIELVLAQPVSRLRYFTAHVVFGAIALTAIAAAGLAGTVAGQRAFALPQIGFQALASLGGSFVALQASIFGLTLLLSAFGREGGRVAAAGFCVALVSFLLQVVATLWSDAAFLLPWSLHGYYVPRAVLTSGTVSIEDAGILLAVAVVGVAGAAWRFLHRDLP